MLSLLLLSCVVTVTVVVAVAVLVNGPTAFHETVPLSTRRHLAASICFRVPLYRDYVLWSGCVDARRSVAEKVSAGEEACGRWSWQSLLTKERLDADAAGGQESGDSSGRDCRADAVSAGRPYDLRQEAQGSCPLSTQVRGADCTELCLR